MATDSDTHSVDLVPGTVVRPFARAALLAALTGVAAQIAIPIPVSPVPVTLQVLIVFLAGLYLGPIWGPVSMGLYLGAGAAGAPVFANANAGLGILMGQSAGFLWSYPIAAGLIGLLVHRVGWDWIPASDSSAGPIHAHSDDSSVLATAAELRDPASVPIPAVVLSLLVGVVVIYGGGVAYAMWLLELGVGDALAGFAVPFVPGELLKIAAAVAIVQSGLIDPT